MKLNQQVECIGYDDQGRPGEPFACRVLSIDGGTATLEIKTNSAFPFQFTLEKGKDNNGNEVWFNDHLDIETIDYPY